MSPLDITVCIPTIPPRGPLLQRAIASVLDQSHPAVALSIAVDTRRVGAAGTRQRALLQAQTPWVAFLDDDDEMLPHHLEACVRHALATGADYVFPWFKAVGNGGRVLEDDPVFPPGHFLDPWNNDAPRQTTITVLVRRELALEVGFCEVGDDGELIDGQRWGEDFEFTMGCVRAGAKISHLVEKTWLWHHDSNNTSGRPDRW